MAINNASLLQRMQAENTLVCCGLDPDISKFPPAILNTPSVDADKAYNFLTGVIDVTAAHVCAYKPQKAFFDGLWGGHDVLRAVIEYGHKNYPGISFIVDCKVGDIENTMAAYADNLFGKLKADGIVVNPYMGDDVFESLADYSDKSIVVLVKTSNRNAAIMQDVLLQDGRPYWRHVLNLVVNRWNPAGNMVPVIASTAGLDLAELRKELPDDMPILFAGVGAQGGSFADIRQLLNSNRVGPFVNSSRGILYPQGQGDWTNLVAEAARELKNLINKERA